MGVRMKTIIEMAREAGLEDGVCPLDEWKPVELIAFAELVRADERERAWVGLTDEKVIEISHLALTRVQAVQMTEAILKEKNT
jgi:hypothetical protein